MSVRAAVVTANYGNHDRAHGAVEQDVDVQWLYLTDGRLIGDRPPPPWQWWPQPLDESSNPALAVKRPKMRPFDYFDPDDVRYVVWIDASMEITRSSFVREAIGTLKLQSHAPLAVWAHPRRHTVRAELHALLGVESQGGKYHSQPLLEQVIAYMQLGFPDNRGLFASGTIVWDLHHPLAATVGAAWFDECARWSTRDQLSLPFVCWAFGVQPAVFPVPQIRRRMSKRHPWVANRWLRIHPHKGQ